jgi:hypothetical protein
MGMQRANVFMLGSSRIGLWTAASVLALMLCVPRSTSAADTPAGPESPNVVAVRDTERVQAVVDGLLSRLELPKNVEVAFVPKNPLVVSVESLEDGNGRFQLAMEKDFLDELTEAELEATIAHELGHVWIFSHHPFLQTEVGANKIALRLVPRDSLVQVYEKLWKRQGKKGDISRFVGD